ncbi:MAG TPA: OmpH family outer membrane protein [Patescibacteria group bacterium]|nr:OmpH family outer membrane protein [Patescibacteria group bacterium]
MKPVKFFFAVAACVVALSSAAMADVKPITYAIVDMNRVMREATAAEGVRSELTAKSKQFHLELEKLDKDLRADKEGLVKAKDSLPPADFEKKLKAFQEKSDNAERLLQERRKTLDFASNSSRSRLLTEATKVIADIAKEKNFSTVFTQEAVLLADPSLDITDHVVTRMNETIKKVAIDWAPAKAPVKQ